MNVRASLDAIQAGDRVRFIVHLINSGDEPIAIPQGQADAVEVSVRQNDAELWRWTVGIRRRSQGGTTVPPTDRIRWVCEWPEPQFGTYTAVATVTLGEADVQATAPVTVTKSVAEAAPSAGPDRGSTVPRSGERDSDGDGSEPPPTEEG